MTIAPRRFSLALLATLGSALTALAAPAVAPAAAGQIIVRYEPGTGAEERSAARAVADVVRDEPIGLARTELVTPYTGTSVSEAVADLERAPGVAYAEPDQPRKAFDLYPDEAKVDSHGVSTNDVPFWYLWGLQNTGQTINQRGVSGADIGAPAAWGITTGSSAVTVAVVDTGVDRTHPDLFANLVPGYDFAYRDADPTDYAGHGTHVAGIIGARGNNGRGVTGVAWQTSLMPVQALDDNGNGTVADIVDAYNYAAAHGARIVNASLGGGSYSPTEYQAIKAAGQVLFVVAAGNAAADNDAAPSYPCAYDLPNIICVAATNNGDRLTSFSNYGRTTVDLAAPGEYIYSTLGGPGSCGGYGWMSGTSMAAPAVSGAAALVLDKHASLKPADVRALLMANGDPLTPADALRIGGGTGTRLDVGRALLSLQAPATPTAPITTPVNPTQPAPAVYAPARVNEPLPPASACPQAPAKSGTPLSQTAVQDPGAGTTAPTAPVEVTVPATAPARNATQPTSPAADTTAPTLSVRLPARAMLRTILARGLRVPATCSERCSVRVDLTLDGRTAKRLGLSKTATAVRVAGGTITAIGDASTTVTVRFGSKAKRALGHVRSLRTSVRTTATDAVGNRRARTGSLTLVR